MRGDVIDIFPADSELEAVRIELFDDQIDLISIFDPLTGSVLRSVPRITIFPKTHYVTPRKKLLDATKKIKAELDEQLENLKVKQKLIEAQRLEQRTLYDIEMIKELGYCQGIENYSRYLSGRKEGEPPPCLFDYLIVVSLPNLNWLHNLYFFLWNVLPKFLHHHSTVSSLLAYLHFSSHPF